MVAPLNAIAWNGNARSLISLCAVAAFLALTAAGAATGAASADCGKTSVLQIPLNYPDRVREIQELERRSDLQSDAAARTRLGWLLALDNKLDEAEALWIPSSQEGCYAALEGRIWVRMDRSDYLEVSKLALEAAEKAPDSFLSLFYLNLFYDFYYQADVRDAARRLLDLVENQKLFRETRESAFFFLKESFSFETGLIERAEKSFAPMRIPVKSYLAAGVFRRGMAGDLETPFPPELDPQGGPFAVLNGKANWIELAAPPAWRTVRPFDELNPGIGGVAYLLTNVRSEKGADVEFEADAQSDGLRIWVNGAEAPIARPWEGTRPRVLRFRAGLKPGWNRILVKLRDENGAARFSLDALAPPGTLEFKAGLSVKGMSDKETAGTVRAAPSQAAEYFKKITPGPVKALYEAVHHSRLGDSDSADQAVIFHEEDLAGSLLFQHARWLAWSYFFAADEPYRARMAKNVLENIVANHDSPIALEYLAVVKQNGGDYEGSEKDHAELARRTKGKNSYAWLGRFQALMKLGAEEAAWDYFLEGYGTNAVDSRFIQPWIAHEMDRRRARRAVDHFERYARSQPFHPGHFLQYADFLIANGFFDEAEKALGEAAPLFGGSSDFLMRKAELAFKKGDRKTALDRIDALIAWNPTRPDFYRVKAGWLASDGPSAERDEALSKWHALDLLNFDDAARAADKDPMLEKLYDQALKTAGPCPAPEIPEGEPETAPGGADAPYRRLLRHALVHHDAQGRETARTHEMTLIQNEAGLSRFREFALPSGSVAPLEMRVLNPGGHESRPFECREEGGRKKCAVPDLQVGSILETDYVVHALPLFWFSDRLSPIERPLSDPGVPTDSALAVFALPAGRAQTGDGSGTSPEPIRTEWAERPGHELFVWNVCNDQGAAMDAFMPPESRAYPAARADGQDLQAVAGLWRRELERMARPTPAVRAAAQFLAAGETNPRALSDVFYEFVRDNIQDGDSDAAEETLLTGNGDALHRTLLLQALLKASGVNAALFASTGWSQGGFDSGHPSPVLPFFRSALKINLENGAEVWADMNSPWLELGRVNFDILGAEGLLFDPAKPGSVRMKGMNEDDVVLVEAGCDLRGAAPACRARITADGTFGAFREELKEEKSASNQTALLTSWFFPGHGPLRSFEVSNADKPLGPLEALAEFDVPALLSTGEKPNERLLSLALPNLSFVDYFGIEKDRRFPILIPIPANTRAELTVDLPPGAMAEALPADVNLENPVGRYRREVRVDDGRVTVRRSLFLPPQLIPDDRMEDFFSLARAAAQAEKETLRVTLDPRAAENGNAPREKVGERPGEKRMENEWSPTW